MTHTYEEIHHKLELLEGFNGNSMSAYRDGNGEYVIRSYNTVIARINLRTTNVTYFDRSQYSVTTSRHQNLVREHFDVPEVSL